MHTRHILTLCTLTVALIAFVLWLTHLDQNENWLRSLYLLSGLQGLVFAGIGLILG